MEREEWTIKKQWQDSREQHCLQHKYSRGATVFGYDPELQMTLDSIRLVDKDEPLPARPSSLRQHVASELVDGAAGLSYGFVPLWLLIPSLLAFIGAMFWWHTAAGIAAAVLLCWCASLIAKPLEFPEPRK